MVEDRLRAEAAARGIAFDQSDMDGFIRNAQQGQGSGSGPNGSSWAGAQAALDNQIAIYAKRAGNRTASNGGTGGSQATNSGQAGSNWFSANAPSMSDYGAPPVPFSDTYTAGQYAAPEWNETFKAPTTADVESSPGYMADENAIRRGLERGAASKGSILSGGFAGAVVPRALAEHASTEYANTFQRAFDTYQQRYGAFSDSANRGAQAFGLNETGKFNQYQSRFNAYDANVKNTQTAERDRWQREIDLARLGLDSQIAGRPSA